MPPWDLRPWLRLARRWGPTGLWGLRLPRRAEGTPRSDTGLGGFCGVGGEGKIKNQNAKCRVAMEETGYVVEGRGQDALDRRGRDARDTVTGPPAVQGAKLRWLRARFGLFPGGPGVIRRRRLGMNLALEAGLM